MRDTRLYVEGGLESGVELTLDAVAAHHLRAVLRARPGQVLRVFNEAAGEWRARLIRLDRHAAAAEVETRLRPPAAEPGPVLLFAAIKKPRLEWLLEKAVELGVARLQPVHCRHGVVDGVRAERLAARIRDAVQQCERLSLPTLSPEIELFEAVRGQPRVVVADERGGAPLIATLRTHPDAALLCGPEGGFSPDEHANLGRMSHVFPVSLGPSILRAETAALMLLACHRALATGES